jgi:hypothetical protein
MSFDLIEFLKRGIPKKPVKIPKFRIPLVVSKNDFQLNQVLEQIKEGNAPFDWQVIYDYGARVDGQAIYTGFAPSGVSQDINKDLWVICKNEYDAAGLLTSRKVATGKWQDRTNYVYA